MQEILYSCAGLDIHKNTIVACIMVGHGKSMRKEIRTFGTMTDDIRELGKWLAKNEITEAAMESTGIYWKPIFNILEEDINLILANARNVKNVPGRKTDVKDSEWICKLFKNGLIEKSFVPIESIRFLRELTRYRRSLTYDLTSAKNRLIKILEGANIKLASVFSSIYGKTAWKIIKMIVAGETNTYVLMENIPKSVKASKEQIRKALVGTLEQCHLDMLQIMINQIERIETAILNIEEQIKKQLVLYESEITLLKTIPGISDTAASIIIAEIGPNMSQFHTENHLASWAGLAPGNNESAGKKKSTRINPGNVYLKVALIQVAWAAVKTKDTYFNAVFKKMAARKGVKKAIIAIGRKILICAYFILANKTVYNELGSNYIDEKARAKRIDYYTKQLINLGTIVTVTPKTETAVA